MTKIIFYKVTKKGILEKLDIGKASIQINKKKPPNIKRN